jgi:hypothetical protein
MVRGPQVDIEEISTRRLNLTYNVSMAYKLVNPSRIARDISEGSKRARNYSASNARSKDSARVAWSSRNGNSR